MTNLKITIPDLERILELAKQEKSTYIHLYNGSEHFNEVEVRASNTKLITTLNK